MSQNTKDPSIAELRPEVRGAEGRSDKRTAVKRREFLKVLGVSGAAVAATACSEETGKLIPYLVSPDMTVPGVSTYYATVCRECVAACGVIAEVRDGRPIKLEGNPEHPLNRGALCARGQAALQGLYNPDRFRSPMYLDGTTWKTTTWEDAINRLAQAIGSARGKGSVFLNQHETGSFPRFLDGWLARNGLQPHLSVDFDADAAAIEANRRTYGVAWPSLSFKDAKLIVSFGADFLEGWGASVPQQLDFADARAKLDGAPRFIYVGARRSLTGLNADEWIACKPGSELAIANALAGKGSIQDAATQSGVDANTLQRVASEIAAAKPVLAVSGVTGDNALDVALAVAAINGGAGTTIKAAQPIGGYEGIASHDQVLAAVERMRSGAVGIAFVRGVNPAYALPKSANFADAFNKVPVRVSFSSYPDETTELCNLIIPDLHSLEQWGDAEPTRGTIGVQQPTMDPVFPAIKGSTADALIAVSNGGAAAAATTPAPAPAAAGNAKPTNYRTWLMAQFPGGASAFAAALPKGIAAGTLPARALPPSAPSAQRPAPSATGDFFLIAYPHSVLGGDGRGANKPWLQELPDPVTKIVWSSWVEIHPETAQRLGIERGDILDVKTASGSVRAPAFPYLGIHKDAIAIPLGQGHRSNAKLGMWDWKHDQNVTQWGYGRYARDLGVNAADLLPVVSNGAGGAVLMATKASISKTGDHVTLPSTEGSARQHGRGIAQAIEAADLNKPVEGEGDKEKLPGDASHEFLPGLRSPVAADAQGELGAPTAADQGKNKGMYRPDDPRGASKRRWAMTIDLARCTGCSACVTACYAENNIPTVGAPWQNATIWADARAGFNIERGREMNWIRLERYFEGNPDGKFGQDFEARFVPMLCQHCGNAPCEPVCPVYATYHSPDGLNVQVYNRCVGTRYCSNNCPYKVRYFNWFGYGEQDRKQYAFPEPLNWQLNPDVTVRGKGVMEKCSFCVQRIREAENRAALEHREVQPDEFTVACAQACPSRAIVFGDAADPNWSIAQLAKDRRAYHVFEELNTFTAVVYLKKVNHSAGAATAAPRA
ncbi:MAG TPA: 4Fe-4S dicluster domain-containing protein [Gemmatimonadaceae bacterium]|nr:4Fe-4S dicluster domain-containing protein [Gemmatimonadaceae bacterium]